METPTDLPARGFTLPPLLEGVKPKGREDNVTWSKLKERGVIEIWSWKQRLIWKNIVRSWDDSLCYIYGSTSNTFNFQPNYFEGDKLQTYDHRDLLPYDKQILQWKFYISKQKTQGHFENYWTNCTNFIDPGFGHFEKIR